MFLKLIFVVAFFEVTLGGSPSPTRCNLNFKDYMDNNDATQGILIGAYASGANYYTGTGWIADFSINQPIGINPPNPAQAIYFSTTNSSYYGGAASGPRYLVPDPGCTCQWIASSNGQWESGIVFIAQPGYNHFYGAKFNVDGTLKCVGFVSDGLNVLTCIDEANTVYQESTYSVLVCMPNV